MDQDSERCIVALRQKKFAEVGRILTKISQEKLYRREFRTFDLCCKATFGFGRSYAYRLIRGAEVMDDLRK